MKPLAHLIIAMFLYSFASCQSPSKYEKADASDIEQERLDFAKRISDQLLSAQAKGGFYQLTEEEADSKMISGLDEALQRKSYQQINGAFGAYQGLTFDHLMRPTDGTLYEIYRFKGRFNPKAEVEVRTILNADGKLAGFFVKPWRDEL